FPWVEIEDCRRIVHAIDAPDGPSRYPVGQQAEEAAAARRPILAQGADCGHWHFEKAGSDFMRESGCIRRAIVIVTDRIHARTVAISRFGNTIVGRLVCRANRK